MLKKLRVAISWSVLAEPFRSLLFPDHCAGCRCRVEEGSDFCPSCAAEIEWIAPPRCETCSQPYAGIAPAFVCPNCRGEAFFFECAVAGVRSRGVVRDMLHRLKYAREVWLARVLATLMERSLDDRRLAGIKFDMLVPVPLHPRRLREREFNQAFLLAEQLAARSPLALRDVLIRCRYTTTQTQLDRRGRRQNLRHAFILRKNAEVIDKNILLIDDVFTTGSTMNACAEALLAAGAASVRGLTVARG